MLQVKGPRASVLGGGGLTASICPSAPLVSSVWAVVLPLVSSPCGDRGVPW